MSSTLTGPHGALQTPLVHHLSHPWEEQGAASITRSRLGLSVLLKDITADYNAAGFEPLYLLSYN